jgi:hypothetical protein
MAQVAVYAVIIYTENTDVKHMSVFFSNSYIFLPLLFALDISQYHQNITKYLNHPNTLLFAPYRKTSFVGRLLKLH